MSKYSIRNFINLIEKVNIFISKDFNEQININNFSTHLNELMNLNITDEDIILNLSKNNQLWIDYFFEKNILIGFMLDKYDITLSIYEEIESYLKNNEINPHVFNLLKKSNLNKDNIFETKEELIKKIEDTKLKSKQLKILSKQLEGYIKLFSTKNFELTKSLKTFKFKYWNSVNTI